MIMQLYEQEIPKLFKCLKVKPEKNKFPPLSQQVLMSKSILEIINLKKKF